MSEQKSDSQWLKVRFDEICKNISDRIDDPKQAGTDYYVGLEHLDSDDLEIRRHGTPDDVNATKLRFKAHQILFGKRRFYQRKIAIAQRDGICSAHMMVLEPIKGRIVKDFLPIFMQSEEFFERAMMVSEGSLSPTIKWKNLAEQEFCIPSKPEQIKIIEIFQGIENAISKTQVFLEKLKIYKNSKMNELLTKGIEHTKFKKIESVFGKYKEIPEGWNFVKLEQVCNLVSGTGFPEKYQTGKHEKIPFIKVSDMAENEIKINNCRNYISEELVKLLKVNLCPPGTVIFAKIGEALKKNRRRILVTNSCFDNNIMGLIPLKINALFLYYILLRIDFKKYCQISTLPYLDEKTVGKIEIVLPDISEQQRIVNILSEIDNNIDEFTMHLSKLKAMQKSILNEKITQQKLEEKYLVQ